MFLGVESGKVIGLHSRFEWDVLWRQMRSADLSPGNPWTANILYFGGGGWFNPKMASWLDSWLPSKPKATQTPQDEGGGRDLLDWIAFIDIIGPWKLLNAARYSLLGDTGRTLSMLSDYAPGFGAALSALEMAEGISLRENFGSELTEGDYFWRGIEIASELLPLAGTGLRAGGSALARVAAFARTPLGTMAMRYGAMTGAAAAGVYVFGGEGVNEAEARRLSWLRTISSRGMNVFESVLSRRIFEVLRRANLMHIPNFMVIDRINKSKAIGTSMKTIDLASGVGTDLRLFQKTIRGYLDKLKRFTGPHEQNWKYAFARVPLLRGRTLEIGVQAHLLTPAHLRIISAEVRRSSRWVNPIRISIYAIK